MSKELEQMTLPEYRQNASRILREDYKEYIPASVYESAYLRIITAWDFETVTRAMRACRDAL